MAQLKNAKHANKADSLARALDDIGLEGDVKFETRDGRSYLYVNVWSEHDPRYPVATVVVDGDGYTWGHKFEHNRHEEVATTVVAAAIKDTLEESEAEGK